MARQRKGRDVSGIFLLDKPSGITSNRALQRVKSLYFARKAGHTGSLDPLASGVLPICLGHATKISGYLLDADKAYDVSCTFGVATDTGDADGQVIEESDVLPSIKQISARLPDFHGEQSQIPPMYSALKQEGKRLYALARQGKVVDRAPRSITIFSIDNLELTGKVLKLSVRCSKGTYIRTLVEDIAKSLGSVCHVVALRRTQAGPFHVSDVTTLEKLEELVDKGRSENESKGWAKVRAQLDAQLKPIDSALEHLPAVRLDEDTGFYLLNGQAIQASDAPSSGSVRLYVEELGLVGLGEVLPDGRVTPKRLFR